MLSDVIGAIYAAIHHYEAEVKSGKGYAKQYIVPLHRAVIIVQKYEKILEMFGLGSGV